MGGRQRLDEERQGEYNWDITVDYSRSDGLQCCAGRVMPCVWRYSTESNSLRVNGVGVTSVHT